jgi:two-component system invasion response regulator UvrY
MIRIIIADDHTIVREGLKQIITESAEMTVAGEASDGQELVEKVKKGDFDAVLLDISMPGRNGIDILKQIKAENPRLPVLMLSMYPEDQYALRAMKAGASGYLTKETAPEELIKAIKKITSGGKYVTSTLAERLVTVFGGDMEELPHKKLSDREFEVFLKISSGKQVSQIAGEMFLSVKTVSTYRNRILAKMDMENNAELMRYAMNNGLI